MKGLELEKDGWRRKGKRRREAEKFMAGKWCMHPFLLPIPPLSFTDSHLHSLTHSLSLKHTHTHTHTCTHTHTHSLSLSLSLSLSVSLSSLLTSGALNPDEPAGLPGGHWPRCRFLLLAFVRLDYRSDTGGGWGTASP